MRKIPNFDPKQVPVVRVDAQLPAVDPRQLTPEALRQRFAHPPIWTPEARLESRFTDRVPMAASVLLGLVMREQPTVLFTLRTAHLSTHAGQISFPGGKADATDRDAQATALREAEEELGLAPHAVEVLGLLPPCTTVTAFVVTPVVALISPDLALQPNPQEVAEVFEVPLAYLTNPAHHRYHQLTHGDVRTEWFSMPYQEGHVERFIWGATAGILRNFYRFLSA
jgi:8-oxo-dGTP pyrophosphatase MutT (NUDIX family)